MNVGHEKHNNNMRPQPSPTHWQQNACRWQHYLSIFQTKYIEYHEINARHPYMMNPSDISRGGLGVGTS